ncbi:MAG: transcriptional repressor [Deltaproteobacteria bacterium]|nr:transcriptional repressor [Deltaproteobacteria bacterium]MBI5810159.1 transcriptional repressor [Deltaproteobacteria bacterium]
MENIISKYKGKGFKLTPQRIAILKFLEGNTSHPTADDIYQEIRKGCPTVSFATVYNTLEALSRRGELLEVTINPERKHFDPNHEPHHHIMCNVCKRIEDIFVDYSVGLKLPAHISEGFSVLGNHVDFYGICKNCKS